MRLAPLLFAVGLLTQLAAPPPAGADVANGCTDTASVSWEIDLLEVAVVGAAVAVPGCDDGELIGLQLITDAGEVPADDPLVAAVSGERARFDLTAYAPRIEPVVGVRVFLLSGPDGEPTFEITVDQRFFNRPGNEQIGLRTITVLNVAHDALYVVPGPPVGYDEVACAELGIGTDAPIAGEGSGTFGPTASGIHLVCYQQAPGPPGGPPATDPPTVLDDVEARAAADADDVARTSVLAGAADDRPATLATTGASIAALLAFGSLLLLAGVNLRRRVRHQRGA